MNLTDLLSQAGGGQGLSALANRFGVTPEQAQGVASAALPAMSSGLKRMAQSPEGLVNIAGALRSNGAAAAFDAPDQAGAETDAQGSALLDQIFGGARGDIENVVAQEASGRSGLDTGAIAAMLPALASMVLGGMQSRESNDSGLGGLVGGLLEGNGGGLGAASSMLGGLLGGSGGASSSGGLGGMLGSLLGGSSSQAAPDAGGGLGGLMQMFDADGDGSVADDLLEKFMK